MGSNTLKLFISLFILCLSTSLLSQSEGGFGFRRFANKANLTSTSVNNADKNASRRAYVHSEGLYYVWNGSAWEVESYIDTLSYANDTLSISLRRDGVPLQKVRIQAGISDNVYNTSDTTTENTRTLTIREIFNLTAMNSYNPGDPIPFQVNVQGNEPIAQLWDFGSDSAFIQQSDTEIWLRSNTNLGLVSDGYVFFQSDSIQVSSGSIQEWNSLESVVGLNRTSGNPILKQIKGSVTGHVLMWDQPSQRWTLQTVAPSSGDDWGSQYVERDSSLSGQGLTSSVLGIKGYSGASNGQVPSKATGGITWITPLLSEVDGSITNEIQRVDTFEIISNILRLSLLNDGVPFSSVNLSAYLDNTDDQAVDTFDVNSGNLRISLENDGQPAKLVPVTSIAPVQSIIAGTGISVSGTNNITITNTVVDTDTDNQTLSWNGSNGELTISDGNTVDLDGRYLQSEVDGSITNEIQRLDTFEIVSNTLRASLLNDGVPFSSVNLAPYLDNTDAQNLGYTAATGALTITGGTGTTIPVMTASVRGLTPDGDGSGTDEFLREDGTWAVPPSTSTDLTIGGSGPTYTIESSTGTDVTISGVGITLSESPANTLILTAADQSSTNEIQQIDTFFIVSSIISASLSLDGVPAKTLDITESVQDIAGSMVSGNTETGILVTYDDTSGKLNFIVQDQSETNELQVIDTFRVNSGNIELSLSNDGQPAKLLAVTSIAPVQSIIAGTGISVSGTNNITVTNTAPDQTVSITNGGGVGVTGTYPNFTLTATDASTTNEIQRVDTFEIVSDLLRISLLNDGVPFRTVDLSSYNDNLYTIDGTATDRTVEVNGAFTFSDDDGDGEFYINMGTLAGNSLSFNSVESSIYYFDLGGPNGFSADANSVSLSTNSGTDFITLNSGSYVQILSDSLLIENVPTTTALKNITGFNSNQTLKKIVGAADGHVLVWDNSNSQWESQPNLAGGLSLGSSNQVLGVNNAGTGYEYKTIQGTTNQVDVTNGAGTVTLSTPQDIHTAANPTFNDLTLTDDLTVNDDISMTGGSIQTLTIGGSAASIFNMTGSAAVSIGNGTADPTFGINGTAANFSVNQTSTLSYVQVGKTSTSGTTAATSPIFLTYMNDGSALESGHTLGAFQFKSRANVSNPETGAEMLVKSTGAWTSTSIPAQYVFRTVPSGSKVLVDRFAVNHSGEVHLFGGHGSRYYDSDNSNFVTLKPPANDSLTSNYTLVWPRTSGTNGQVLKIRGDSLLYWGDDAGGGGGSDGNGIYSGDGNIPTGGSEVSMDAIGESVRFSMNTGNTSTGESIIITRTDDATHRYIVMRGAEDSLRVFRFNDENYIQSYSATLNLATDEQMTMSGDSLEMVEGLVETKTKMRFLLGMTPNNWVKRFDGDAATSGDIIVSDGTDWTVQSLASQESNFSVTIRPAQITSTTHDWSPTGYSTTKTQNIEATGDGSFRTITGLSAATRDGVEKSISNGGTNSIVIAKQHTGSSAANRFDLYKDIILYPRMECVFRYDSVGARWKLKYSNESSINFGNQVMASWRDNTRSTTTDRTFQYNTNGGTHSANAPSATEPLRVNSITTGAVATSFPSMASNTTPVFLSQNETYLRCYYKILTNANASTNAESYELKIGFETDTDTILEEGALLMYHHTLNTGQWRIVTHDGTTSNTTNTSEAFSGSTEYDMELIYYPYGEIVAFINGTRYATTSNLPADLGVTFFAQVDKDNGTTSRPLDVLDAQLTAVFVSD